MTLRRTPGALGVPLPQCSCLSTAVLGNFGVGVLRAWRIRSIIFFADVTSLKGAVTSYVMSQCHTCIGHMTFYYKRAANTSVGVLACCLSICQIQLYHQRPTCGWCLTRVGHNASSASPGWSLLPLTVIIALALVNSTVSPVGTFKYLNETQEYCSTPC